MQFLLSNSLRRLSRLYSQAIINAMPEFDLAHDAEILLLLASVNEVPTQTELCEKLQLDKSRMASLIEGLKEKGLVYIERNPADRRAHFVYLTANGKNILPKIQEAIDQVNRILNQELDDVNLNCFYATLFQMQHNLIDHVYLVKD